MILSEPYAIKSYSDASHSEFFALRNENVLIFWPHGVGDWVFLGTVLSLADKSNNYYVARFGDHHFPIFENAQENIHPVCISEDPSTPRGMNFPKLFNRDGMSGWGVGYDAIALPKNLHDLCVSKNIRHVIFDFPEVYQSGVYPFHTKARNQLRHFLSADDPVLRTPIKNCISYDIPKDVELRLEAFFTNETGYDRTKKLCLISRIGHTHVEKNWGHEHRNLTTTQIESEEPIEFISLMKKDDPNWMFVSFEGAPYPPPHSLKSHELGCFSSHDLFGSKKFMFAHVLKFLLKRCDLFVGVPTGPTMMAALSEDFPSLSLWLALFPSWYEEPKQNCTYILSQNVFDQRGAPSPPDAHGPQRAGTNTFLEKSELVYEYEVAEEKIITGEKVMEIYKEKYA